MVVLISLLIPVACFISYFHFQSAKSAMKSAIAQGKFRELMVVVTASELRASGARMLHDHEFEMNGRKYDIVEQRRCNGEKAWLVIMDEHERKAEGIMKMLHGKEQKREKNVQHHWHIKLFKCCTEAQMHLPQQLDERLAHISFMPTCNYDSHISKMIRPPWF
ncbi:MAG: hypothetical protein ACKVOR_08500 [Flavobacteriales bacterium]